MHSTFFLNNSKGKSSIEIANGIIFAPLKNRHVPSLSVTILVAMPSSFRNICRNQKMKVVKTLKKLDSKEITVLASLSLMLVSLWQIEMIWVCHRRNQAYVIPFNSHKSRDLWFWHDLWFVFIVVSWIVMYFLFTIERERENEGSR